MLLAFHKPYGVLSQFSDNGSTHRTLAEFGFPRSVYALGRLDSDSEGLLLLSDEKALNDKLLNPRHEHPRRYHVQVERIPTAEALRELASGVLVSGERTKPCTAKLCDPQPTFAERVPPIRVRKSVPDCWIELELREGKNRQVRRMTAAIGHPTLRLIRTRIGKFELGTLEAGRWIELNATQRAAVFS